jgi:adhesin/invasin
VTINGVPAPLYYVSPTQINGQIPYETAAGSATAVIAVNGSAPAQISFSVVPASPSVLVYNGNHAVAVNQDGRVNAPTIPALPGDIEVLYLTGIGQAVPAVATGAGAPSVSPFAMVNYSASITLNGQPCQVFFLGLAPGFPALAQANFQIPTLPPGDYSLVVTVNGVSSDPVVLSVGSK